MKTPLLIFSLLLFLLMHGHEGEAFTRCGPNYGNARCMPGDCCSIWGWCGAFERNCGRNCQSQCPVGKLRDLLTKDLFERMLPHRDAWACQGRGFYTYEAFIEAAESTFLLFGNDGDTTTRLREIAAFFAQTSHVTDGGWPGAPGGRYAWGYCYLADNNTQDSFCIDDPEWPCVPGKKYYPRGPFQLAYNTYYGRAGSFLGLDLLSNPDLVATDPVISFKTAIWFWMRHGINVPQNRTSSCHGVMVGTWTPSNADANAGRLPGFGTTTNVINGDVECGRGPDVRGENRIGFYKRNCDILGVSYGNNLDCYKQVPFGGHFGSSVLELPTSLF